MKKILIITLALILALTLLCSCGTNDTNNENNSTDQPTDNANSSDNDSADGIVLSGENRYKVIYPETNSDLKGLALKIYDKLLALDPIAATKPAYYSLTSDKKGPSTNKEILVGLTNRPASEKAASELANYPDFTITVYEGNIAIYANTEARIADAIDYFIKNLKVTSGGDVYYANTKTYVDVYAGDYPDATIGGNPLKDYKIIIASDADEFKKAFATQLSNVLTTVCGTNIPVVSDSEPETALEILVGKVNRSQSIEPSSINDRMFVDDGKIVFAPSNVAGYERLINKLQNEISLCKGKVAESALDLNALSHDAIRTVTFGAVNITEQPNGLRFNKFSDFQIAEWTKFGRYDQAVSSTGIRLDFYTNSSTFYFAASQGTNFELFINGESKEISSTGIFDVKLEDNGENRITVLFPNHQMNTTVKEVRIDENATLTPYTYDRKFLILGDSITQGYSAVTDSLSWANRITRMFNADSLIQAISGGCYQPSTLDPNVDFNPDYILVAYGTNDWYWGRSSMEDFKSYAKSFYERLAELYPEAKIIGITPIWRMDNAPTKVGSFDDMCAELKTIIESVGGYAVNGVDLVPHQSQYYGDSNCLHPNDAGFEFYANNLYEEIKDIIK
jgi:lysophospholipase L1-like esterase